MEKNKFLELLSDPEFMKKLVAQQSVEDIQKLFKDEGVQISEEDVRKLAKMIVLVSEKGSKISDADMENILGGVLPEIQSKVKSGVDSVVDEFNKGIPLNEGVSKGATIGAVVGLTVGAVEGVYSGLKKGRGFCGVSAMGILGAIRKSVKYAFTGATVGGIASVASGVRPKNV